VSRPEFHPYQTNCSKEIGEQTAPVKPEGEYRYPYIASKVAVVVGILKDDWAERPVPGRSPQATSYLFIEKNLILC
jgi:hypothetical protein